MSTMRPVVDADGVKKVSLGEGLVFPLDALPVDLRRRWDIAMHSLEAGDDIRGALKGLTHEAVKHLWPDIMARAAQRGPRSVLDLGITEKDHGAVFKPLTTMVEEHDAEERGKEGVQDKARLAGRGRPCPLCGK